MSMFPPKERARARRRGLGRADEAREEHVEMPIAAPRGVSAGKSARDLLDRRVDGGPARSMGPRAADGDPARRLLMSSSGQSSTPPVRLGSALT